MATKMTPKELKVIKLRKINFRAKSNMAAGCRACIRVGIQRVKDQHVNSIENLPTPQYSINLLALL